MEIVGNELSDFRRKMQIHFRQKKKELSLKNNLYFAHTIKTPGSSFELPGEKASFFLRHCPLDGNSSKQPNPDL